MRFTVPKIQKSDHANDPMQTQTSLYLRVFALKAVFGFQFLPPHSSVALW